MGRAEGGAVAEAWEAAEGDVGEPGRNCGPSASKAGISRSRIAVSSGIGIGIGERVGEGRFG